MAARISCDKCGARGYPAHTELVCANCNGILKRQRDDLLAAAKALLHSVTEGAIADALTLDAVRGYGKEDTATIKAIADLRAAINNAEGGK